MFTPGGHQMSVAMTNCGSAGWVTDRSGYRYDGLDPIWKALAGDAAGLSLLAAQAAARGGFENFAPDACLINRYTPGARTVAAPGQGRAGFRRADRVGVAGAARVFLFGGPKRADKPRRYRLAHGDVVVWGGPSRLFFHGVAPLADGEHADGSPAINLFSQGTVISFVLMEKRRDVPSACRPVQNFASRGAR